MIDKFSYLVWMRGSLDNSENGASGKKMAAFWVIMLLVTPLIGTWATWAFIHNNWKLLPQILDSCLLFAGLALSINGVEKIVERIKKPKDEKNTPPVDGGDTSNAQ